MCSSDLLGSYKWPCGVQSITTRFGTEISRAKKFAACRISSDFPISSNQQCSSGIELSPVATRAHGDLLGRGLRNQSPWGSFQGVCCELWNSDSLRMEYCTNK